MSEYIYTFQAILENFQFNYVRRADEPAKFPHKHDYYELLFVHRGLGRHLINGDTCLLERGSLCLILPDDSHQLFKTSDDFEYFYINIPFQAMHALFEYLGPSYTISSITEHSTTPVLLSENEALTLERDSEQIIFLKKIGDSNIEIAFRIFILNLLTRYFLAANPVGNTNIPQWLQTLILNMLKKENFTQGLQTLYRLSGRSPEYVIRMFKKHLNKSPSAFINELRLDYAVLMLANTNMSIMEISMESGFNSLSHFYHLFKDTYGESPKKFRKIYTFSREKTVL